MSVVHLFIYVLSGFVAGVMNAVAGGGSVLLFPLLLSLGIPAVTANATMSLIVQPGSATSAYGYRHHLKKLPKRYYWLLLPTFLGALVGAALLVRTSTVAFQHFVPFFMAFAVLLLAFQRQIHHFLYTKKGIALEKRHRRLILVIASLAFFGIAIYGGYFGAGFGIITLAFLGYTELSDIQQMNGLKNLSVLSVGMADALYFTHYHMIDWKILPFFALGNLFGGLVGATYGSRLPARTMRAIVLLIATALTVFLFWKFR